MLFNAAIEANVKTYLLAIGASAIFIVVEGSIPVHVGISRDLDKSLMHLRRRLQRPVRFGWIVWSQQVAEMMIIVKKNDLLAVTGIDGVRRARSLSDLIQYIEQQADNLGLVLTPHQKVIERASVLAAYVDQMLDDLRTSGKFAEFNQAYKQHRLQAKSQNQPVWPYWMVIEHLRRVTIRALLHIRQRELSQQLFLQAIQQEFPWFKQHVHNRTQQSA